MRILFLHGWQSTPGGTKPTYLKDHGHTVLNPALPDDDFEEAVRIAQEAFDQHHPDVVVGSSRGRKNGSRCLTTACLLFLRKSAMSDGVALFFKEFHHATSAWVGRRNR